jgi:hypothetical protein
MQKNLAGAIGGMAAGVPMVVALTALEQATPSARLRGQMPKQLATRVARQIGLAKGPSSVERHLATAAGHFGYGGAAGALYPQVSRVLPGPTLVKGALFGAGVWAARYLLDGRTLRASSRSGNAMHLGAHLVWGSATALVSRRLIEGGRRSDVVECARDAKAAVGDEAIAQSEAG